MSVATSCDRTGASGTAAPWQKRRRHFARPRCGQSQAQPRPLRCPRRWHRRQRVPPATRLISGGFVSNRTTSPTNDITEEVHARPVARSCRPRLHHAAACRRVDEERRECARSDRGGCRVVALVADLYAFASGHDVAGTVAVAVLLGGVGMGWLALRTRRCARSKDAGKHNISMRFASRRQAERPGAVHTVGHVGVGS